MEENDMFHRPTHSSHKPQEQQRPGKEVQIIPVSCYNIALTSEAAITVVIVMQ